MASLVLGMSLEKRHEWSLNFRTIAKFGPYCQLKQTKRIPLLSVNPLFSLAHVETNSTKPKLQPKLPSKPTPFLSAPRLIITPEP